MIVKYLFAAAAVVMLLNCGTASHAADFYAKSAINLTENIRGPIDAPSSADWTKRDVLVPRIVMDDGADGYVAGDDSNPSAAFSNQNSGEQTLVLHSEKEGPIAGTLYYAMGNLSGMNRLRFSVNPADHSASRSDFLKAKLNYYDRLWRSGFPGKALFRHEANEVRKLLGTDVPIDPNADMNNTVRENELADTFDLFGGGRAVSENLQLDRAMPSSTQPAVPDVKLSDIKGITIRDFDWKPLIKDANPKMDVLASLIPADQHAFLFPSFEACRNLASQVDQRMGSMISAIDSTTGDSRVRERYERQLGFSMTGLGKLLGPAVIGSIAVTGSDLYLPEGTDLAILLEAKNTAALHAMLTAQLMLKQAIDTTAKPVKGDIAGVAYTGLVNADRSISSYVAIVGPAVVITNSLAQLEKLAAVKNGSAAISSLPEYAFFRTRYVIGDSDESALLILSDATIRRWCSPQWRIAESRRTRAGAVLADLQAKHLKSIVSGNIAPQKIKAEWSVPQLDEVQLDQAGVSLATYGRLQFMTPISELKFDEVTKSESELYDRWRTNYESNFKRMDPIAVQLKFSAKQLSADISVMPLVAGSDYTQFIAMVGSAKLTSSSGDPHDSLAQAAIALDPKSKPVGSFSDMLQSFGTGAKIDPLGWVGHSISIYADDDPFWKEFAAAKDSEIFLRDRFAELPLGLYVESASPLKLAAFLTALHAFADQSAPNLTKWENIKFGDISYIRIKAADGAGIPNADKLAVYYVALPKALILSLNEDLIKRAITRQNGSAATQPSRPWLGESACFQIQPSLVQTFLVGQNKNLQADAQVKAWKNLIVLNEIHRLLPSADAVAVYQQVFGVTLIDGGRGNFLWDNQSQTMQSTVYGSPENQKEGPTVIDSLYGLGGNFGVTFENGGVRGRAEIALPTGK